MLFFENTLEFATPLFGDLQKFITCGLALYLYMKWKRKSWIGYFGYLSYSFYQIINSEIVMS